MHTHTHTHTCCGMHLNTWQRTVSHLVSCSLLTHQKVESIAAEKKENEESKKMQQKKDKDRFELCVCMCPCVSVCVVCVYAYVCVYTYVCVRVLCVCVRVRACVRACVRAQSSAFHEQHVVGWVLSHAHSLTCHPLNHKDGKRSSSTLQWVSNYLPKGVGSSRLFDVDLIGPLSLSLCLSRSS